MDRKSNVSPFKKWLQVRDSREISGAPGGNRTPDPLLRRQMLYPTELRARRNYFLDSMYLTQPLTSTKFGCHWVQLRDLVAESQSPARDLPRKAAGMPHQRSPLN